MQAYYMLTRLVLGGYALRRRVKLPELIINRQEHVMSLAVEIARLNDQIAGLSERRDQLVQRLRKLVPDEDLVVKPDGTVVPVVGDATEKAEDPERPQAVVGAEAGVPRRPGRQRQKPTLADMTMAYLASDRDSHTHKDVALAIGAKPESVRQTLVRMESKGLVERLDRGRWKLALEAQQEEEDV